MQRTHQGVKRILVVEDNRRVAVIGTISAGPMLKIAVSDTRRPETFTVRIRQVATTTNALRESTAGYTTTLRPL